MPNLLDSTYPVMEMFHTIQGEGMHAGTSSFFIRLGGCTVGCTWCDSKGSWPLDSHPKLTIGQIIENAKAQPFKIVVVTGGEPLMHDCDDLVEAFQREGFKVHVETSGTEPLTGNFDWITFSPKKFKAPLPEFYRYADELKVIVFHPSDLKWAQEHADQFKTDPECYLQPEWSKKDLRMQDILKYISAHPEWKLSIQGHKYLGIP